MSTTRTAVLGLAMWACLAFSANANTEALPAQAAANSGAPKQVVNAVKKAVEAVAPRINPRIADALLNVAVQRRTPMKQISQSGFAQHDGLVVSSASGRTATDLGQTGGDLIRVADGSPQGSQVVAWSDGSTSELTASANVRFDAQELAMRSRPGYWQNAPYWLAGFAALLTLMVGFAWRTWESNPPRGEGAKQRAVNGHHFVGRYRWRV